MIKHHFSLFFLFLFVLLFLSNLSSTRYQQESYANVWNHLLSNTEMWFVSYTRKEINLASILLFMFVQGVFISHWWRSDEQVSYEPSEGEKMQYSKVCPVTSGFLNVQIDINEMTDEIPMFVQLTSLFSLTGKAMSCLAYLDHWTDKTRWSLDFYSHLSLKELGYAPSDPHDPEWEGASVENTRYLTFSEQE